MRHRAFERMVIENVHGEKQRELWLSPQSFFRFLPDAGEQWIGARDPDNPGGQTLRHDEAPKLGLLRRSLAQLRPAAKAAVEPMRCPLFADLGASLSGRAPQSGQSVVCLVMLAPVLLFVVVVVRVLHGTPGAGATTTGPGPEAAPPMAPPATPPTAAPTGPPTTAPATAPPAAPVRRRRRQRQPGSAAPASPR